MTLFLLVFVLVYGGLHAYGLIRFSAAFRPGPAVMIPLLAAAVFLVLSPILTRLSEQRGHEGTAFVLAHIGYPWMGFLFLFFVFSLVLDLGRLLNRLAAAVGGMPGLLFPFRPPVSFVLAVVLAVAVCLYGLMEARTPRIERISVETEKLPPHIPSLKIVQISDLHLGLLVRDRHVKKMAEVVKKERPDLLLSTGDLVDGTLCGLPGLAEEIGNIPAPLGKFAVTGNHEFYAGLPNAIRFTETAGFRMLRGESAVLPGILRIAGVDDPTADFIRGMPGKPEEALLNEETGLFTLFLKHRPAVLSSSEGRFDLQLSGHTHRGQIFPFALVVRLVYPRLAGTFPLSGGSLLHVSRGTGTWGPPIRVLSPPEITVIELKRREAAGAGENAARS
ncbi:MAG TPA: metallophosphoesterase [Syntrophales bacterium]|nr:metallophosphoesterase [Syntrophales bacterium]HQN78985.1 metallophosphoesterase [Syntrophales bacterium]HQQ28377.1 metallophosphoesterase [Syntrophales bacterium]